MASRVGSYLSDENVKRMCIIDNISPGSKTYGLFKLMNNNQRSQRPQNVSNAMLLMSKTQNIPYKTLVQNYENSINTIPNESVLVYTPSTRVPQSVLDARGRVAPPESIIRPVGTGVSSRPLIQGASVNFGTEQPQEGQLGDDVSVNTPTPTRTARGELLAEQQTGSFLPEKTIRAETNIRTIREGKGPVDNLIKLKKGELRYILEELGGQYVGQKTKRLVDDINDILRRSYHPLQGQQAEEEAGPSEEPTEVSTYEPDYDPNTQY